MIETLAYQDMELNALNVSYADIINSITISDVKVFLESLGVTNLQVNENKGYIICPTICHNPLHEEASMKLYWYQDHKIFRCYTECNEAFSIFTLYQKVIEINEGRKPTLFEAETYVKNCLKYIHIDSQKNKYSSLSIDLNKYKYNKIIPELPEYPKEMLTYFTEYYHPLWLKDGITIDAMQKFNISFSIAQNKIIIPHKDIHGRLIGIRARSLDPKEVEEFGKYRPLQVGSTLYTHPLQFNLYGIYEHQEGIRKRKTAIIAEGEKSVLLDEGYYKELSNTVACCGSTFNKYHISLLTDILGANEIVVALDKEYNDLYSEKARNYRKKLESLCRRYLMQANFSYIWDYDNLLEEKDSPFDKGKEVFEHLYKTRVKVR